ncbi:hypothetical protein L9F63_020094, partial [Diploptera punctata]
EIKAFAKIISSRSSQIKAPGRPAQPAPAQAGEVPQSTAPPPEDKTTKTWVGFEEGAAVSDEQVEQEAAVQQSVDELLDSKPPDVEEEEEEEEETEEELADDDIFDTSYIDVVKLAYIPDSPTQQDEEFDPFDTSIAEKVIKEEEEQRKSKKNVISLGCAVEVLTGRLETTPTLPSSRRKSSPRRSQEVDLLLGDNVDTDSSEPVQTLLDDHPEPSLLDDIPIINGNTEITIPIANKDIPINITSDAEASENTSAPGLVDAVLTSESVVETHITVPKTDVVEEDDLEDEFAALAAESISKKVAEPHEDAVDPFDTSDPNSSLIAPVILTKPETTQNESEDPFDTSFAENILPGKAELKIIENEILSISEPVITQTKFASDIEDDFDFDPRKDEIKEIVESDDTASEIPEPGLLSVKHRDLLGGSTTQLHQDPLQPLEKEEPQEILDPFDTSVVDVIVVPGKAELKFIEKELLGEIEANIRRSISDPDFDPRAAEEIQQPEVIEPPNVETEVPDLLNVKLNIPKVVEFDLPTPSSRPDLLVVGAEEEARISKPLTPFYVESKANEFLNTVSEPISEDPFDTSFVENLAPGKAELKIIEIPLEAIPAEVTPSLKPDLLVVEENAPVTTKPLTPAVETKSELEIDYTDPFDTSIANNLAPGRAELKVLESELVKEVDREEVAQSPLEKPDLLNLPSEDNPLTKTLTPQPSKDETKLDFESDYIDPFDTSIVDGLLPGKAELKVLESELIDHSNPFLSNSDFNIPAAAENPFLNLSNTEPTQFISGGSYTNPFAQYDFSENHASTNEGTSGMDTMPTIDFFGTSETETSSTNIFSTATAGDTTKSFFDDITDTQPPTEIKHNEEFDLLDNTKTEALPEAEFCKETSDIFSTSPTPAEETSIHESKTAPGPPRRPPPPRPEPPSKETKDLILSVTGAMEATSSHLLDRLQATRTPSPTPMRDLHSPSPTPDMMFPDLLEVGSTDMPMGQVTTHEVNDDLKLIGEESPASKPPRPPPRPVPPPPKVAEVQQDIMDIFSMDTPVPAVPQQQDSNLLVMLETSAEPKEDLLMGDITSQQDVNLFGSATMDLEQADSLMSTDMLEATEAPLIKTGDDFDAFAAKFENAAKDEAQNVRVVEEDPFDPFTSVGTTAALTGGDDGCLIKNPQKIAICKKITKYANKFWGAATTDKGESKMTGFEAEESFDAFLSMNEPPPVPQGTPARFNHQAPKEGEGFMSERATDAAVPTIAPPPKSPVLTADSSPRFNPFDKSNESVATAIAASAEEPSLPQGAEVPEGMLQRTDSQETPPTPLFDEDVSQPLEDFPRVEYKGEGWEMHLRQPNKKKITGQRFWKKVFVRLVYQGENPALQLFNTKDDKDPFQELPLQACYSVSDIGAQQFDAYGKIFTVKLQYVFYKERPGVRPGQVTKAERITNKLSKFAQYAIQGDYEGCKEFGSDLKKLGLPVEHAPQISQLFKIGSQAFEDMKQFSVCVEEALFRLSVHRDRALNYKTEEVQITAVDELYVEQDKYGHVDKQIARVRLFFLGFLAGMPDVELGVNDLWRQGKEVVGRHDIIPVITEEWIRLENVEFHSCVQQDEYERTRVIKFKPPDACYIELMRFRVRPPKNRELPIQLKAVICVTGNKVEIKADILVPGFSSRKLGQIPCEDIMVRFPIPECWIYLFRVEKHFRYGSVKSTHRRTGKVKGIERFLGAVETLEQSLIEVTSGQAKYEHQHRAIVWRMSRLPKEGQGAYTTHTFVCRMGLTSYDQIPDQLAEYCYVEFTMPATQVSHTTVRSVSLANGAKDDPPEKYVRYLARHEYRVGIEHTQGEGPGAYISATITKPAAETPQPLEEKPEPPTPAADSDSDSSS